MREALAYIVTIISRDLHLPLSRNSRFGLQHKIVISLANKRLITPGVLELTKNQIRMITLSPKQEIARTSSAGSVGSSEPRLRSP